MNKAYDWLFWFWTVLTFLIAIILILVIVSTPAQAGYVFPERINNVSVRFVVEPENKSACVGLIESVPQWYGIHHITFLPESARGYASQYFMGGTVEMYGQCKRTHLVHEIAHAYQERVEQRRLYQMREHGKVFYAVMQDIYYTGEVKR